MKKIIYLIVFMVMLSPVIYGQVLPDSIVKDSLLYMRAATRSSSMATSPKVTIPSPEVVSLFKYVDIPVSQSTGIPDISIPLYNINCGDISLPISISYHSGGRKVSDVTGAVGLGWTLNVGGMVSRVILGEDDLKRPVPKDLKSTEDLNSLRSLGSIGSGGRNGYEEINYYLADLYNDPDAESNSGYSSEYDIFSYILPSTSGKFIIYDNKPLSISGDPIKIEMQSDNFRIIDENGVVYAFKGDVFHPVKTAWELESIESPDKKNKVSFKWKDARLDDHSDGYSYLNKDDEAELTFSDGVQAAKSNMGNHQYTASKKYQWVSTSKTHSVRRLESIEFGSNKILFDIEEKGAKINSMTIVAGSKEDIIRKIRFSYSELDKTDYKITNYKLETIAIVKDLIKDEIYQFKYTPSSDILSRNYDFWGYKNGNENIYSSKAFFPSFKIEKYSDQTVYVPVGNDNITVYKRDPSEAFMKEGMLEKIIYPTGGTDEFSYEINIFWNDMTNKKQKGAGLRIKSVKTTDGVNVSTRSFKYPSSANIWMYYNTQRNGTAHLYYDYLHAKSGTGYDTSFRGFVRTRRFTTKPSRELSYINSEPIHYSSVEEYNHTSPSDTLGKIVYSFDDAYGGTERGYYPAPSFPHPPANAISPPYDSESMTVFVKRYDYFWRKANIKGKHIYKYDKTNKKYELEKSTLYDYEAKKLEEIRGLKIYKYISFTKHPGGNSSYHPARTLAKYHGMIAYLYSDYYINRGKVTLKSVKETEYRDGVKISTSTTNIYDDSKFLLKEKNTTNSSGKVLKELFSYPFDKEYSNNDVAKKMISLNMLNYPMKHTTRTGAEEENIFTSYADFGTNFIKKKAISSRKGTNSSNLRTVLTYDKYDAKGNLLQYTGLDGVPISYIWGYNYQYPIAEIKNAKYSEISTLVEESMINSLAQKEVLTNNDHKLLNYLRDALTSAHVTSYSYLPLVGMLSATNSQGVTTYFGYDAFGRLKRKYLYENENINVLEEYDYNYISSTGSNSSEGETNSEIIEKEPTKDFTLSIEDQNYYPLAGSSIRVDIYGGSGHYTYNWIIKDASGKQLASSSSVVLGYTFSLTGKYTLTCTVTDKILKKSKVITKVVNVEKMSLGFTNRSDGVNSNGIYTLKGDLNISSHATITFECEMGTSGTTSRTGSFIVNGQRIYLDASCANSSSQGRCVKQYKTSLPKGIYTITGELNKSNNSSDHAQISIRIINIESTSQTISYTPQMGGRN